MMVYYGLVRLAPAFLAGQLLATGIVYNNTFIILIGVVFVVLVAYWHEHVLRIRHPHVLLYDQDNEVDMSSFYIDEKNNSLPLSVLLDNKNNDDLNTYPLDQLLFSNNWNPPPRMD